MGCPLRCDVLLLGPTPRLPRGRFARPGYRLCEGLSDSLGAALRSSVRSVIDGCHHLIRHLTFAAAAGACTLWLETLTPPRERSSGNPLRAADRSRLNVRTHLFGDFGKRSVGRAQPSWPSRRVRTSPHSRRLRRGDAAATATGWRRLPKAGPDPADPWSS